MSAAYRLNKEAQRVGMPVDVTLLEAGSRVGGIINTYRLENIILELGPDSFITEKPAALQLCMELGIEHRLVKTDEKNRRTFVAHQGRLHPVPEGYMMMAPTQAAPLLKSGLFTFGGKLRMLQEFIIPKGKPDADETLSQFVTRRFGKEALDKVVQPLVGGIFTSDPDRLSVRAALPQIVSLEQKYGSIIKGMIAAKRNREDAAGESGARYGMFVSLDQGLSLLIKELERNLPQGSIRTHSLVRKIDRGEEGRWRVELSDGSVLAGDAVILATPAFRAADMLDGSTDAQLVADLRKIEYASSAVINLLYRRSDIRHAMDGFGFVVPRTEKKTILACSFSSIKWPDRVPVGKAVLRVFVGGALQPDVFDLSDEHLECLIWQDLNTYMGIKTVPLVSITSRFPKAMPQYNLGHTELVSTIEKAVANIGGLELAGNAYHGVGIPDCIASGERAAARVLSYLPTLARS